MRFLIPLILLAVLPLPCLCAPVAVWEPGKSSGIELLTSEDGRWEARTVGGRETATLVDQAAPPNAYFYFRFTPEMRAKVGSNAYLVLDFFDDSMGIIGTQFNSATFAHTAGLGIVLTGSGQWERGTTSITGANFHGAQNAGADLRLCFHRQGSISRLEVYTEKPDIKIPTNQERLMKNMASATPPKDMFYTFGNDADEVTGPLYKSLGVTSVESYVTWESCERNGEGLWDWSHWDRQVKVLKETGLKWVPFLILSPAYSTPDWFRASHDHHPCRCLEHGTDSKIESLWNPDLPKWIDRFIGEFAKRYKSSGVIESVLLGIQGDFGEAIYSVWGGGWTFDIPGEYHNHAGFWCDDPYALADYRKFLAGRYKTPEALNRAWGTHVTAVAEADFPARKDGLKAFRERVSKGDPLARRQWLDFVDWYRDSMTEWSDWWMATTRKHFPDTPIYLCTGGDAPPEHGSDFAEQCRVAAKHNAGVRITNEASHYASNFAITRWVAAAGKHYGAYFSFEPAGAEDIDGIVARIYNATASGANQLHDYNPNVVNSRDTIEQQRKHLKYLFHVAKPIVPVALWYPNVSMTLNWGGYLSKAAKLRDYTDFDYVDESMLRSGALSHYKVLVVIHGNVMEPRDAGRIAEWVKRGGRVLVMDVPKLESVEATAEPETILFAGESQGRSLGKGSLARVSGWDELGSKLKSTLADLGLPVLDLAADGVYATQIAPARFLFLNTGSADVKAEINVKGKKSSATVGAGTIADVKL